LVFFGRGERRSADGLGGGVGGRQEETYQYAPFRASNTRNVFIRILTTSHRLHWSMYSTSRRTTSLKSRMSFRPLTCHRPVIPGLMPIHVRCYYSYKANQ